MTTADHSGATPLDVCLGDVPELLIEASAGTGKTYALTTLVARLVVEERAEIGDLLVVTFTVAATGELRDRIRGTLRAALRLANDDSASRDGQAGDLIGRWRSLGIDPGDIARRLDNALLDLDRANVMTIHGFCQRVLADFAFDGGLPFAFEIAGDGFDTLCAAVRDEWRRSVYPLRGLRVRYALKKAFVPDSLADWLAGYVAKPGLEILGGEPPTDERLREMEDLERAWGDAASTAKRAFRDEMDDMNEGDRSLIGANLRRPEATFANGAEYFKQVRVRRRLEQANPDSALVAGLVKLEEVSRNLLGCYDELLPWLRQTALENTRATLQRRVRVDRQLGYDDLLTGVHSALRASAGERLALRIRERYGWALIDEYQDTDRVQADIFRRIYRVTRRDDESGGLIVVGDPKQSIYRFRSADIFAYLKTSRGVAPEATLHLRHNYRSVPALTAAVNAVFDHPCPFALSGIDYRPVESAVDEARLRIEGDTFPGAGSAPFQFRYVRPPPNAKPNAKPWNKNQIDDLPARLAAEEIGQLLTLADEGKATLDGKPVAGSDVAVLVRTTEQGRKVARALRERGIGSVEIGIESVFQSREAEHLERLLWAIAKPQSPPRARGALAGDVFGLHANALARLQDDDSAWNSWTERLAGWLDEWHRAGVATLVRRILESPEAKGADHLLRYPDGARRLTNVMHLAELLQAVETRGRLSPTGLAAWFTRQRSMARDRDEVALLRLDSDEQLVKIATMHAAKGLEFPVVYCPFVWDSRVPDDKRHWADYHGPPADHPERLHLNPSKENRNADWLEQFSDETRLLYVALTRAKERCVVTWAKVNQGQHAPLAWLLYGRKYASSDVGPKSVLNAAGDARALGHEEWRSGLDDLAQRCPDGISVTDVEPDFDSLTRLPASSGETALEARQRRRETLRIRQMTSYSALVHSAGVAESPDDHETVEQPDRDEMEVVADQEEEAAPETADADQNAFTFPAGRRAGNCLHRIFERLDRGEGNSVDICHESLHRYRIGPEWLDVAQSLVENTRATRLVATVGPGKDKGFRLAELARPVPEMEFHLPLDGLDRRRFGETLAAHGYGNPFSGSQPSNIEGYLRGFIDLVAGHDGVWYVLDYKSNWLGPRVEDYRPEGNARAMREHRYPLQYLLYLVALNRYLSVRLPGYEYDKHMGGAFYLFLRGMDPATGTDRGVYFDRPGRACIEDLDACFKGAP